MALSLLQHTSFSVRNAAAYVLSCLGLAIPSLASLLLQHSLYQADSQVKSLLNSTGHEEDSVITSPDKKKSSIKETEKLSKMYLFHGHALVISLLSSPNEG